MENEQTQNDRIGLKVVTSTISVIIATTFLFGSALGLESNIQPFNDVKINDTSFKKYHNMIQEEYGSNIYSFLISSWTYPGARLGAEIHNYSI